MVELYNSACNMKYKVLTTLHGDIPIIYNFYVDIPTKLQTHSSILVSFPLYLCIVYSFIKIDNKPKLCIDGGQKISETCV